MSKILFNIIATSKNDEYAAVSFVINFLLTAILIGCIFINPIIFFLWIPYKIFTMLLAWFCIFNTLKDLKDKKIIKNDIDEINKNIKYISDNFIIYILFSSSLLFACVFYFISNLSKFSWKEFVKSIETKADNFNNFISNKIQNKFSVKEQEEPEITKETYRD